MKLSSYPQVVDQRRAWASISEEHGLVLWADEETAKREAIDGVAWEVAALNHTTRLPMQFGDYDQSTSQIMAERPREE